MICGDCKGSGQYVGFASTEACKTCQGSGSVLSSTDAKPMGQPIFPIGPRECKNKEAPQFAQFDFANLSNFAGQDELQHGYKWIFLRSQKITVWQQRWGYFTWEGSHRSKEKMVREFKDSHEICYALYQRISEDRDVFELVTKK